MTDEALAADQPRLVLPGFMPDAVGFAFRFTLALLLAYMVGFTLQLSTASSAGVCVAIVMQQTPGMALNKAFYRVLGTLAGGVMALVISGAFPQQRLMLLAAFAIWLGACTFVASLLRDFRAYGAVLAGYTVAVIDIGAIDNPGGTLLGALNRVAAILIGIACVAVVNSVFSGNVADATVSADFRRQLRDMDETALGALAGGTVPDAAASARQAAAVLALRTEASYGAAELPDGRRRHAAMSSAIAALLAMLAASRAIRHALPLAGPAGPAPATRDYLDAVARTFRAGGPTPTLERLPVEPLDALLVERAGALMGERRNVAAALGAAFGSTLDHPPPRVTLRIHNDYVGALLNAARTMIAVGLGASFCVYAGYAGASALLILQSSITALLGMQPRPSVAARGFLVAFPFALLVAGLIDFRLLPVASGFVPFALAVGGLTFPLALLARHPRVAGFGPALFLFLTVLMAPSNIQSFDLGAFLNQAVAAGLAVLFVLVTFRLVLPVSPRRRLFRLMDSARTSLRRTLRHGRLLDQPALQSRNADRLSQALIWIGSPDPARGALLGRMSDFADLDIALRRAWSGLAEASVAAPELAQAVSFGRDSLTCARPEALEQAARCLLGHPHASAGAQAALRAASGLYGAKLLLERQGRALWHYGVLGG